MADRKDPMDSGASAALKTTDFGSGIYEDSTSQVRSCAPFIPLGFFQTSFSHIDQANTNRTPAVDAEGAVGKQFKPEGAIGSTAQKLGGPFDKDGEIGKEFKPEGKVGGTVQEQLGSGK